MPSYRMHPRISLELGMHGCGVTPLPFNGRRPWGFRQCHEHPESGELQMSLVL